MSGENERDDAAGLIPIRSTGVPAAACIWVVGGRAFWDKATAERHAKRRGWQPGDVIAYRPVRA